MEIFNYGQTEIDYLKKHDKKLGTAIDKIGIIEREVEPDVFAALIRGMVAQQISSKAAVTVFNRLKDLVGEITIDALLNVTTEDIQKCGMSLKKAGYIKAISMSAIDFNNLKSLSDEEIISKLVALNGVGVWTCEMLLIFSLQRPNVVSYGDLAIRRGMMRLYGLDKLTKKDFDVYCKRYSPYGSVASLYLWALSVL